MSHDGELDLFGFESDTSVTKSAVIGTRGKPPIRLTMSKYLWKLWCDVSERPVTTKIPPRFTKAVTKALESTSSRHILSDRVRRAVFIPPHARDPEDIGRVCSALTVKKTIKAAQLLAQDKDSQVYLWEDDAPEVAFASEISDIERIIGTERTDWNRSELENATILAEKYSAEELTPIAGRVKSLIGESHLLPSEILANLSATTSRRGTSKKGRDPYATGKTASNILESVSFELDSIAEGLHLNGCPPKLVAEFHNDVPEDYWESVRELLEENDENLPTIYDELVEEFSFHPSNRKMPKW